MASKKRTCGGDNSSDKLLLGNGIVFVVKNVKVLQSQTKVLTKEDFHMTLETDDRRVGVGGCKANISFFVLMT
ncbi:hypothetical protein RHGRI_005626 [Rhododendron griersonianum]|uniref:Uncharacterized protein n=1 Tax=Rhododendron griersonianum TaxID=479676 RepID=A0AAV6LF04_9ERIC|nr:hypothetical protein RHGRI_005626 [Rhododendron griersonianum]